MHVLPTGSGPVHQAPFPNGPSAEVGVDAQSASGPLAAA